LNQQLFRVMSGALLLGLAGSGCFDTSIIPADEAAAGAEPAAAGKRATPSAGTSAVAGKSGAGGSGAASAGSEPGGAGDEVPVAGQASQAGGAGGAGGSDGSGVTWLSFVGSQAPSSESANGALGINGTLYAYKDDCATLTWNEATRCASGRLCTAGPNYENWGIAVGFDFNATGPDGAPADSKLVWNPEQAGVRGVTWRIRGSAPGLQLWVLNMASRFQGQCSEMTCEIAGPPDGANNAALEGTLLFDQMVKDIWANGISYVYDPAAVFALQFKLPAINVGSASFDFCVDALGVVR